MFRNYIITSLRKFRREPVYALINITGLVLGLTCSTFILLWVLDELSFNTYHKDNSRVFRVLENQRSSDGVITTGIWTPGILAETLKSQFPEVEQASRIASSDAKLFRAGEKAFYEYGNYADPSIFDVLNLPLLEGNPHNTLPDIQSVAISKKMAMRYFGHAKALGNTLQINNSSDLTVTAVFEDIPQNSTEHFDFILPMDLYIREDRINIYRWDNDGWMETFVKLKDQTAESSVDQKLRGLIKAHNREFQAELFLFPFSAWRLYADFEHGKQSGGRIVYVISFSLVALFILVIACINFMNLATARATTRAKEVGVRKVSGASRGVLIRQFMTEDFGRWASIFVRYQPGKTTEAMAIIRSIYQKNSPDFPLQYNFLDEDFEWQFRTELMASTLIKGFTAMAVIISCLGLFGLALFSTGRRQKEISIRKVLGAPMSKLVVLLCGDLVRPVIYAILIACPIAYYLAERFLSGYVYRTQINTWTFISSGLVMLLISVSITTWQAVKTAMTNPVDAMRSE